ncbi:hypothetical protein ACLOJK_024868 [Asimina triloba]
MVARLTPDQKVACSIHVGFSPSTYFAIFFLELCPNGRTGSAYEDPTDGLDFAPGGVGPTVSASAIPFLRGGEERRGEEGGGVSGDSGVGGRRNWNWNPASENHGQSLQQSIAGFLRRPQAFPFLLSLFILLTWLSLSLQRLQSSQLQHPSQNQQRVKSAGRAYDGDNAYIVKFASEFPSLIVKDPRGWLLNPVSAAADAAISVPEIGPWGAQSCISVHVGEIRPGGVRGNHRHHTCNETFIIWGARTRFRLELKETSMAERGYKEVIIGAEEVAVAASRSGTAHALINIDHVRSTFFLGCQDSIITYNSSTTDFNVWKDL